ncbi:hypothetical protein LSH36_454g01038 [Paralvinella palmiformis]|uniref:Oxidoreductase FAD/NAD(P)-binding domain-containing protein n=1 Tax=Paralvinella palmiformis TaxID=53620 RepID=A0AAD9JAA0_9ANNE|nr:hypothetical protein LSH36_454g01038 [Paralvinella palmiformis]
MPDALSRKRIYNQFCRTMTSTKAQVHKDVPDVNSKDTSEVTICEMRDLSPRIKHLTLNVYNKDLTFKAGQLLLQDHESSRNILITVIYSARSMEELIFKDVMDKMANRHKSTVKIHYFITRQTVPDTSSGGEQEASNVTFHAGRITQEGIHLLLANSADHVINRESYICGPSSMIETIITYLNVAGLSNEKIHYEKWW